MMVSPAAPFVKALGCLYFEKEALFEIEIGVNGVCKEGGRRGSEEYKAKYEPVVECVPREERTTLTAGGDSVDCVADWECDVMTIRLKHPSIDSLLQSKAAVENRNNLTFKMDRVGSGSGEWGGLYAGRFGPHGEEIVDVRMVEGRYVGVKVTGDPNVPGEEGGWRQATEQRTRSLHTRREPLTPSLAAH